MPLPSSESDVLCSTYVTSLCATFQDSYSVSGVQTRLTSHIIALDIHKAFQTLLNAGEVNVFDTRYDVQWLLDGRLSGEPANLPRLEMFRKKPVVTKPIMKAWLPDVAACETIQVRAQTLGTLLFNACSCLEKLVPKRWFC